jgi:hypothetical protein
MTDPDRFFTTIVSLAPALLSVAWPLATMMLPYFFP